MKQFKTLFFLLLTSIYFVNAQSEYPVITQIVTDNAGLFSESETLQLKQKLLDYETRTTHQIVVLTINNLGNDTVDNYAFQTFNKEGNQFGQATEDNGILILVAKNDREFRIEIGDGLTPIITDLLSSRIQRNYIIPAFKESDYFKGIDDATSQIIQIIDDPIYANEFVDKIEQNNSNNSSEVSIITKFFTSIFLSAFLFIIGVLVYNYLIIKDKDKRINIITLFSNNKKKFLIIWFLIVCIVTIFNAFFWYVFMSVFAIGFLSIFVAVGFVVILKKLVYTRVVDIYTALFTGKLGILIFPFYLPVSLILLFAGLIFTFLPVFMGGLFVTEVIFSNEINFDNSGIETIHFAFFIIAIILLFFIAAAISAYKKVKKDFRKSFGFSFFKIDKSLASSGGGGSSRGYSSSGSSSYSSSSRSSSSSSFSGGGGRSSGGGSSGSW